MYNISPRKVLLIITCLAIVLHGSLLLYTIANTYDAYVHMFFAKHYASNWFDSWNYKWYTGFTITSYPPLVHQILAILSKFFSLKTSFGIWALCVVCLFVRGIFVFSRIWVGPRIAILAAILAVFSSSFAEALHIFGQLPSLTGVCFLLNACGPIHKWVVLKERKYFWYSIILLACTTGAHHVSTIFGMVFFVFPVLAVGSLDSIILEKNNFEIGFYEYLQEIFSNIRRFIVFGISTLVIMISVIFSYWYWSKTDPISQVSIPHGSRASFLEEFDLAIVFFYIPWGFLLLIIPLIFLFVFRKRSVFLGVSFFLCFLFGTGGTSPLPEIMLGKTAFNILTLDRFTFWGTLMALPFAALVLERLYNYSISKWSKYFVVCSLLVMFLIYVLTANMSNFKKLQPESIDPEPIVNFLASDQHSNWRYLTLGFGDQFAYISALTPSLSVDGNYHSVRRLPEMTSRAVERLENSKYLGQEGILALQDFISNPFKFNLKYIFSNDKFYDPLLYFYGWNRIERLQNGIVVWEKPDVKPLPSILKSKQIPKIQRLMWGILPMLCLFFGFLVLLRSDAFLLMHKDENILFNYFLNRKVKIGLLFLSVIISCLFFFHIGLNTYQSQARYNQENLIKSYYHSLDFKKFEEAHSYLSPEKRPTFEKYMNEISVNDGLTASYAKAVDIRLKEKIIDEPNFTKWLIEITYNTGVKEYTEEETLELEKIRGKWFIIPKIYKTLEAPENFFSMPNLKYKSQGRRGKEIKQTRLEDIIDRPDVLVIEHQSVMAKDSFHIVGRIINLDIDPAHISVVARAKDTLGTIIEEGTAAEFVNHRLLPRQSTSFRVSMPYNEYMESYVLEVLSVISQHDFYPYYGINLFEESLQIDNYGTELITIPKVLLTFMDEKDRVYWVNSQYIHDGIPSRKMAVTTIDLRLPEIVTMIEMSNEVIVNGVDNQAVFDKFYLTSNKIKTASSSVFNYKTLRVGLDIIPMVNSINK